MPASLNFSANRFRQKGLYQRIINVVANPRPFIKTKTNFGPDRRRNINANYIGPERRKGGKADVIRQTPLLDKARAPVDKGSTPMPRSKDTAAIVTYGDHEVITPENNLRGAVAKGASGRSDDPVARAERALADLSPSSATGWTPNANGSTRLVMNSPEVPMRRVKTRFSTPP